MPEMRIAPDNDSDAVSLRDVPEKKEKRKSPLSGFSLSSIPGAVGNAVSNGWSVMRSRQASFDKPLFLIVFVLVAVGVTMMSSASFAYAYYSKKGNSTFFIVNEIGYSLFGLVLMILVSLVPPNKYKGWFSVVFYIISVALLGMVFFFEPQNGVHRWISIFGRSFQTSELAKFAVVLLSASYITKFYKKINVTEYHKLKTKQKASRNKLYKWLYSVLTNFVPGVLPFIGILAPVVGILLVQPHLSCAIIIILMVGTMMFMGGTRASYFIVLGSLVFVGVLLVVFTGVIPYGQTRIAVWKDPFVDARGDGWQNIQSLYAISSGGLFGAGFGNSRQKYLYIAEPQNDFVFAVVCEELGFIGATAIILLFVAFVWRGFSLSMANKDRFQRLVGIGITSQIGYQMLLNVAVVTKLVPNTGISLPFFSYGGTSMTVLLAEIGVLLAISRGSKNKVI